MNRKKILDGLKTWLVYGVMFVVIYSGINWWRQPVSPVNPQLQFLTLSHQPIDLQRLSQQRPVLIYFWGSWCGSCRQTSPRVNDLSKQGDYPVVTVAVESGNAKEVKNYLNQHQWQFVTINDEQGGIFDAWQGQVTPSFVIVHQGKMVQGLTGFHPGWELSLRLWLVEKF